MLFLLTSSEIYAEDDCSRYAKEEKRLECEIEKRKNELGSKYEDLDELIMEGEKLSQKLSDLSNRYSITQEEINSLIAEITEVEDNLAVINENLFHRQILLQEKEDLRDRAVRQYYKLGILNKLETMFMFSDTRVNGFRTLALSYAFGKSVVENALYYIDVLNVEIRNFEQEKKSAQDLKDRLAGMQADLLALSRQLGDQKLAVIEEQEVLSEEKEQVEEKIQSLEEKIEDLTAKQQAILREKYGDSYGTVGDYEAPSYKLPDPPFKPAFAAMSYGAFTHYNGMSQYGAKGRADDGDNYEEILQFYYKTTVVKKDDFPKKISVQGCGELDYQYYLYGIAEMPSDWDTDALKAQAIAARTYAYGAGKPICTTQSCQVFLKSKADNPPDKWKKAVDDTKNKILKDPKTSQYSSTAGGYINNVGWDLDGDNWPQDAYEKKAGSPWFYKAWYTQTYTDSSSTCGRSTPWLNEDELADILNSWVVWSKGRSSDRDHISPVTTNCWGGDPYSHSKMAEKADDYGSKYNDVKKVWVDISNGGYTSAVYFETDKGTVEISGDEFKTVFNLRAPAYVALRSRLFDFKMEK